MGDAQYATDSAPVEAVLPGERDGAVEQPALLFGQLPAATSACFGSSPSARSIIPTRPLRTVFMVFP
jgi:hypothetical protein